MAHAGVRMASRGCGKFHGNFFRRPIVFHHMKIKHPLARRTWRERFVEIARQVEALEVRSSSALASGLRPRARMAGFATLRRGLSR